MTRALALVAALGLLTLLVPANADADAGAHRFIVGHDPEDADDVRMAITLAGGRAVRSSAELGFTVATTSDPTTFLRVMALSPAVEYTERDDATRLDGAQWNGAQWNGAQWNGAQWNGAQWNGAQWNSMRTSGAQWNGAQWNGAQWNAADWTIRHYGGNWRQDVGTTDPGLVWQWGSWATGAVDAWEAGATGTRTAKLCVLDTGVAWDHPDLAGNMWTGPGGERGWNAIDPAASAYDDAGHGTHIAGIAAAQVGNAYGMAGVANAQVMAVKVLDANGAGYESDLAFGLAWCAMQEADVAVMALSVTEVDHPTLAKALTFAAQRDVLLLASAGNDGGDVSYPASHPSVVGVSAVDGDLALASFSGRGAEVDLAAPGVAMLGTFPGGAFAFGSGTSQAVGYAAGVAALVRDTDGSLSAADTLAILRASARDLGAPGEDDLYGAGLVDVDGAFLLARS